MEAKAIIVQDISKKSGNEYYAVKLIIGDYEQLVYFLNKSEIALLQLTK